MQVNYWCDAGPTGLLSLDDLGFGWDLLAMSRYWLLLHFPFSLWFRQHHFWVTLDNQQLRCHLQSTLCCTKGCIRFSPRKEHLDQLLLPFGKQTPLDFRAVGHWEGGRKGRITWSLYCPLLDGRVVVPCRGLDTQSGERAGPSPSESLCQGVMQCIKESG